MGETPTHVLLWANIALAAPVNPDDIRVIDGDTIRAFHKKPNVRLVAFNAPETRRAQFEAERELVQYSHEKYRAALFGAERTVNAIRSFWLSR